jgi:catechol 2,3-dioxygenase-like lactoylglutathione lyase family enzyme
VLDHVSLPVSDRERSKRFYSEAPSPLGYELIMEHHISGVGFGRSGKLDSGSEKVCPPPSTSPSPPTTAPPWRPSTRGLSQWAGATTVVPGFAPSTIRPTKGPTPSVQTATTSKRSAIGRARKPEPPDPYSPNLLEEVFWEVG